MRPWPYAIRKSTPGMTAGAASDGAKCFPGSSALGRGMLVIFALLSTLVPRDLALAKVSFDQLTSSIEGISYLPSISADGTRIAFVSTADLKPGVLGNTDGSNELFLWSQGTGITQLTNTWAATILQPSISADGTKIALASSADLTGGNADLLPELFLWTQGVGFTQLTNTTGGFSVFEASISPDGTKIAFISNADLTPGAPGNADHNYQLFLWSQGAGITQLSTSHHFFDISMSADGKRIAFSSCDDLTPGAPGNADENCELFLWTQGVGFTQLTNTTGGLGGDGTSISADGTQIAFRSMADLTPGTPGNPNGHLQLFIWTEGVGFIQLTPGDFDFPRPSISGTGDRIAFSSNGDLSGDNPDGNEELFLWNSGSGITQLTNSAGLDSGNGGPSINADGTRIAFVSSSNL